MFITAMDSKSKKAAYFKRALALILMSLIFITSAFSVAALSRTAVITADGKEMTVTTMSTNTDDILEQAGIDLSLYDEVVRTENENNSIYIVVNRAFPVSLTADGMIQYITMTAVPLRTYWKRRALRSTRKWPLRLTQPKRLRRRQKLS